MAAVTDDAVLVCLIKHAVMGETLPERRAARLLLDLLRNGNGLGSYRAELDALGDTMAAFVTDEANKLIARYDLK